MKSLLLAAATLLLSQISSAKMMEVSTCEEQSLSLNSVFSMKTYANQSIKIFEVDREEPAAAPVGLAVTVDRGEDLASWESFCFYIPGLTQVNVTGAKSKFEVSTNTLTLTLKAAEHNPDTGLSVNKTLEVVIKKGAQVSTEIVRATLK